MPIQPGTRLGAHEVKRLVGHGAMGTVYLARHEALDWTAAVKVMLTLIDDPVAVGRDFARLGPNASMPSLRFKESSQHL